MILDHIAISVSDIKRSLSWYKENLNCEVLYEDETWALIKAGSTKIAMVIGDSHPPHIAFKVDDIASFPCSMNEIKEHRDHSKYYYQEDPDGNTVEWIYWGHLDR
mgnify:CR=1 FL=1